MKRFLSILVLSLYLLSTAEWCPFLKIPDRVDRYSENKSQNAEIQFQIFTKTHFDLHSKNGNHAHDHRLPVVIHAAPHALVFIVQQKFHFEFGNNQLLQLKFHKINSANETSYNGGFLTSVWEPPRFT